MIRKFQESDAGQVMQIWLSGNKDAHPFIPKEYWEANFEMVQDQLLQAEVFVYNMHGEIQGFIGIVDGYIAGIFMDKKYRSLGVGKKLLDHVKSKYPSLSLSVYQKNNRAIAFYFREGFSVLAEKIDEATGEAEYTMVWRKEEVMSDIEIRSYAASDYNAVCIIHDASRKAELSLASLDAAFLPFSIAAERENFFDYPHIDVATIDNAVVAFSAYTDDEFAWLYVSPDMKRKGIGRKLVAKALDIEPGIKYIEVLYGNEPAKKLYEAMGFYVKKIEEGVMPGNESYHVKVYSMHRLADILKAAKQKKNI